MERHGADRDETHSHCNSVHGISWPHLCRMAHKQDYTAVNKLQAQYKITPLSAWGKPYTYQAPPVNAHPGLQHDGETAQRRSSQWARLATST